MKTFKEILPGKSVMGVIHLQPLPGSPRYQNNLQQVIDFALKDVESLEQGGMEGIVIENFFDSPFFKDHVGPETVAAMSKVATIIRQHTTLPICINVLRNDAMSALAIATACSCEFIRVNIISSAMTTDQGIIEGKAADLLRMRRLLSSDVLILADVLVKHAKPLGVDDMETAAAETWERGGADGIIISGIATGKATKMEDIEAARKGAPEAPILIGSGATPTTAAQLLSIADSLLVGTYVKQDGKIENPVDVNRVKEITSVVKSLR